MKKVLSAALIAAVGLYFAGCVQEKRPPRPAPAPQNQSGYYDQGVEYYKKGKYEDAAKHFKMGCDKGHNSSCERLGEMYKNGKGVAKNPDRSAELYKKACGGDSAQGCRVQGPQNKAPNAQNPKKMPPNAQNGQQPNPKNMRCIPENGNCR